MPLTTSEDVHGGLKGNKTIVNSTPVDGHGNVTDVTLSMITIGNFKFQVELEQYAVLSAIRIVPKAVFFRR